MIKFKNIIKNKKGITLLTTLLGMMIFAGFAVGAIQLEIQLNNATNLTSIKMEAMSVAYDKWNSVVNEDFNELEERITKLNNRQENINIGSKYLVSTTYGTKGKFTDGTCKTGTAGDGEKACLPVTISVSLLDNKSVNPVSLSMNRIASINANSTGNIGEIPIIYMSDDNLERYHYNWTAIEYYYSINSSQKINLKNGTLVYIGGSNKAEANLLYKTYININNTGYHELVYGNISSVQKHLPMLIVYINGNWIGMASEYFTGYEVPEDSGAGN